MTTPEIHICIQQPSGYVHSLGFLDQARYFRYQLRRLGARASISKNRLRHDAINFVFGAHLGFDPEQRERHACIFVNLEQLGDGGAQVSPEYMHLLETSAVTDYDAGNVAAYSSTAGAVPVVPLLYAPYLAPADPIALEERPMDLLFVGSVNERRRAWIERIEACGVAVSLIDAPLYAAERDGFIVQAEAVLNTPYYESSRFEQARVSHCLSLGTPVISERAAQYRPHPAFEDTVHWLEDDRLEQFFTNEFASPAFFASAREALLRFTRADPIDVYARLLAFALDARELITPAARPSPGSPRASTSVRARTTRRAGSTSTSSTGPSPTWCWTWRRRWPCRMPRPVPAPARSCSPKAVLNSSTRTMCSSTCTTSPA
jgi:hypothetical protein